MELSIGFLDIWRFLKKHFIKFMVLLLVCALGFGLVAYFHFEPAYSASTTVMVTFQDEDQALADYKEQYGSVLNSRVQAALTMSGADAMKKRTAEALGIQPGDVQAVKGEQVNTSTLLKISVSSTLVDKVAAMADTAAKLVLEDVSKAYPSPALASYIYEPATTPNKQSPFSVVVKDVILGLVLGAILTVCILLLMVFCDRTVRGVAYASEVTGLQALGIFRKKDAGNAARRADAFRMLRAAVMQQAQGCASLLIVPASHGDSADMAAGLAAAFGQIGKRVLLVDADMHRPQIAPAPGVKAERTLPDVLNGNASLAAAVTDAANPGVSLLAAAPVEGASADLLSSAAFRSLMQEAAAAYDVVLVAAPPEADYPDADCAAAAADAVLLTVRYGKTPLRAFQQSLSNLRVAGGKVCGFVLTGQD